MPPLVRSSIAEFWLNEKKTEPPPEKVDPRLADVHNAGMKKILVSVFPILIAVSVPSQADVVWTVGLDDNAWPSGDGGGPNASFVQEGAGVNALPGDPNSPEANQQADDDYYFAGVYSTVLDGGGYIPVGTVVFNEEAVERSFAGVDNSRRFHFNLPNSVDSTDLLSLTFDFNNLDGLNGPDVGLRRYGVEVYFNGIQVMPEVLVYEPDSGQANWTEGSPVALLDDDITTPSFSLDSVRAQIGSGYDNYVELRGINYNAEGGGNWMGLDYVQLNATPVPEPSAFGFLALAATGVCLACRFRG